MCGYAQRVRAAKIPKLQRILSEYDAENIPDGRFFPGTQLTGILISDGHQARTIDATWWFTLAEKDGTLKPDRSKSVFNARNLKSGFWKPWLKSHRCILPATAIVETLGKQSYLMDAEDGLLIGGLYRTWKLNDSNFYSCALITCDPHERFKKYHDKSTPLFLPMEKSFLDTWLDPTLTDFEYFRGAVEQVRLPTKFKITPVKNSQTLERQGEDEILKGD